MLKLAIKFVTTHLMEIVHVQLNYGTLTCLTKLEKFECLKQVGRICSQNFLTSLIMKEVPLTVHPTIWEFYSFSKMLQVFSIKLLTDSWYFLGRGLMLGNKNKENNQMFSTYPNITIYFPHTKSVGILLGINIIFVVFKLSGDMQSKAGQKVDSNKAGKVQTKPQIKSVHPPKAEETKTVNKATKVQAPSKVDHKAGPLKKVQQGKGPIKIQKNDKLGKAEASQIQFKETKKVPEPEQVAQMAIRHYPYYHNKKTSKVYFYPFTSTDGDCRYTELPQQPKMTEQLINELTCCFPKEPIFVVPADIALKKLEQFKKQGKYQAILDFRSEEFKNFNKAW